MRIKLGNKGRVLVENEYSWEYEEEKLLSFYKMIIEKN